MTLMKPINEHSLDELRALLITVDRQGRSIKTEALAEIERRLYEIGDNAGYADGCSATERKYAD